MSSSQKRISLTILLATLLVAGALFSSFGVKKSTPIVEEVVVVTATPERTIIKTLDENNNGVPDWQEALLIAETINLPSEEDSLYEEPETLTGQFAINFFQDIVRAENYDVFGATPEELVSEASTALSIEATDELLTLKDIIISNNNSLEELSQYGEVVAEITTRYPDTSVENEAAILERALREQNPSVLDALDGKITVYENILGDTLSLTVPAGLQQEHLNLVNSYNAILSDIRAMRNAFTDPMLTLIRMKRYQEDAQGLSVSFSNLYTKLQIAGATWDSDSPVFLFIQK